MQHKLTKPEIEMLAQFRAYDTPVSLIYNYRRDTYDVVLYPVVRPCSTKAERATFQRLIDRNILISSIGGYMVNPDHWIDVYGATFELKICAEIQHEYNHARQMRDDKRTEIEHVINGSASAYSLDMLWNLYREPHTSVSEHGARWSTWMSGGKRALAFHHHVTDAYVNSERELQALEYLMSCVSVFGVRRMVMRESGYSHNLYDFAA